MKEIDYYTELQPIYASHTQLNNQLNGPLYIYIERDIIDNDIIEFGFDIADILESPKLKNI
jgi:hypothetical protein